MNSPRTFLAGLALAPALLALTLPLEEISFRPSEGLSLTRTVQSTRNLSLDDMEMTMNGQPMPMDIQIEMDMSMTQKTVVTDLFDQVADGRAIKLTRSYDELAQNGEFSVRMEMMPDGGQDATIEGTSELEGKKVVFQWNVDENDYVPSFEGEGDADLLEGLVQDMDMLVLLPTEASVAEGGTWDIDVKKLRTILAPGGNMKVLPQESDLPDSMPGMGNMSDFASMFEDLIEGEAKGEFRGTREIDGVLCQVIGVKLDVRASADLTEQLTENVRESLPDGMGEVEVEHVDMDVEIEGEGQLYWDAANGVAHSFELNGTMSLTMDMGFAISMGEQNMSMEQNMTMSGTFGDKVGVVRN